MLQKPEKVGYNWLSWRQVLRVLGIGAVMGSLPGCTLIENKIKSSNNAKQFAPLSSKEQQLINAFRKLDRKLSKEAAKAIKKIRDDYKQDGDLYSSISRARRALERVFNHYNSTG